VSALEGLVLSCTSVYGFWNTRRSSYANGLALCDLM
jgi:hypothetical protein